MLGARDGIAADQDAELIELLDTARDTLVEFATNEWLRLAPTVVREVRAALEALSPGETLGGDFLSPLPLVPVESDAATPSPLVEPPSTPRVAPSREGSAETEPPSRPSIMAPPIARAASTGTPAGSSASAGNVASRKVAPLPSRSSARLLTRTESRVATAVPLGPSASVAPAGPTAREQSAPSATPGANLTKLSDYLRVSSFYWWSDE